jgi:hypothetical protein
VGSKFKDVAAHFQLRYVLLQNEIGNSTWCIVDVLALFDSSIFIVFMMHQKPLAHKVFFLL